MTFVPDPGASCRTRARVALAVLVLAFPGWSTWASAQPTELVSLRADGGQPNDTSDSASVSADGRHVAFVSKGNDVVEGDVNTRADVFVRDRVLGTTVRVSVSSAGVATDRDAANPSISSDGRFVAFDSTATNLVENDANGVRDVFLHDRDVDNDGIFDEAGQISTVRASVGPTGLERGRASRKPAVSGDGRWVAFEADEGAEDQDIRIFDRDNGVTAILSIDNDGVVGNGKSENPQLSSSGRFLVFESSSNNLVADDENGTFDVFWVDRDPDLNGIYDEALSTLTVRASVATDGEEGDDASRFPHVSDDGRYVVFASTSVTLADGITNNKRDVFLRDLELGVTSRISLGTGGVEGLAESTTPWISADGRCVVFQSAAGNLVASDTNNERDVFLYDRDADRDGVFDEVEAVSLTRVSVDSNGGQGSGDSGDIFRPVLTADGLAAVFDSGAPDLVASDVNGKRDVFLHRTTCGDDGYGFTPITPCRLLDTRDEDGPVGGPTLDARSERTISAAEICDIPPNAKALTAIITSVLPEAAGYLTLYPFGTSRPLASSVNFAAGTIVNNNQFIGVSVDGTASFNAFNGAPGATDLIVDVTGYFN